MTVGGISLAVADFYSDQITLEDKFIALCRSGGLCNEWGVLTPSYNSQANRGGVWYLYTYLVCWRCILLTLLLVVSYDSLILY